MTVRSTDALLSAPTEVGIHLYWLPLGAGGHFVRMNGRLYESIKARFDRRPRCDLYHSGLVVVVPKGRYVIEMTPVPNARGKDRGVVTGGPVGIRSAGRFRIFRYELRSWQDGVIPDASAAVDSPRRVSADVAAAERLLQLAPQVPALTWGRDEVHAGEMWNSNSMIAWLLARTGLDMTAIKAPVGGRAPGWQAGVVVAARQATSASADGEPWVGASAFQLTP